MNRRQFMIAGIATAFGGVAIGNGLMKLAEPATSTEIALGKKPRQLFSAFDSADGKHFVGKVDTQQGQLQQQPLPFRAHDILPLDNERVLAFGRRPVMQCALTHLRSGEQTLIPASEGRHFYGHGCLSEDKRILFTTENDYDAARGVIGLHDATTLQTIGEYDSFGVGPHDIHLMPDGKTLVVANGGIETHPDYGRRKLNIRTMQPSLVYIDVHNGQKLDEYRLDDPLLSIRHLTVTTQGDVGVATQWQGNLYRQQPQALVAWQAKDQALQAFHTPPGAIKSMQGYMADLAYDPQNHVLAVTSPRGNQITFWDTDTQQFLQAVALPEPSGIAFMPEQEQFLVSSAQGGIYTFSASRTNFVANPLHQYQDLMWDNHLVIS